MTRAVGIAITGILSLVHVGSEEPIAAPETITVQVIPSDTLHDVAVAVWDEKHPTIYVNPTKMQQFGPLLTEFFLAHEFGHVQYRHTRAFALSADGADRDAVNRSHELEADCFATRNLAAANREAVLAAVQFFSQQGQFRFDRDHPSGAQRAAKILSCLPE